MIRRNKPSLTGDMAKIRETLASYEGSPAEMAALGKIAADLNSLAALAKMNLRAPQLKSLVVSFVGALEARKDFRRKIPREAAVLRRAPELRKAVTGLRKFVNEVAKLPTVLRSS